MDRERCIDNLFPQFVPGHATLSLRLGVKSLARYHLGSTRLQLGSTCFRISASSSRLRKGIWL